MPGWRDDDNLCETSDRVNYHWVSFDPVREVWSCNCTPYLRWGTCCHIRWLRRHETVPVLEEYL